MAAEAGTIHIHVKTLSGDLFEIALSPPFSKEGVQQALHAAFPVAFPHADRIRFAPLEGSYAQMADGDVLFAMMNEKTVVRLVECQSDNDVRWYVFEIDPVDGMEISEMRHYHNGRLPYTADEIEAYQHDPARSPFEMHVLFDANNKPYYQVVKSVGRVGSRIHYQYNDRDPAISDEEYFTNQLGRYYRSEEAKETDVQSIRYRLTPLAVRQLLHLLASYETHCPSEQDGGRRRVRGKTYRSKRQGRRRRPSKKTAKRKY